MKSNGKDVPKIKLFVDPTMSNDREEIDKHVRKLIHLWNPEIHRLLSEKEKKGSIFIILSHLIYRYGRKKGVELPGITELDKSCDSIIRSVDFGNLRYLTMESILILIIILDIRKVSDRELDVFKKYFDGEYGPAEFRKQLGQARYPSIAEKEVEMNHNTKKKLDNMHSRNKANSPIDPKLSARIQKYMKGYEDAPDMYRLDRFFVCETANENGWDDTEVEKVLDRRMNGLSDEQDHTQYLILNQIQVFEFEYW